MTKRAREKNFHHELQTTPDGKFYFLKVDLEDQKAPKPLSTNMTEAEVREFYRTNWGYSEAVIDERLRKARELKPL